MIRRNVVVKWCILCSQWFIQIWYGKLVPNAVSATLAIQRRPILVAFYDTHGDTEDTFST